MIFYTRREVIAYLVALGHLEAFATAMTNEYLNEENWRDPRNAIWREGNIVTLNETQVLGIYGTFVSMNVKMTNEGIKLDGEIAFDCYGNR
jgi:hypothetical protein